MSGGTVGYVVGRYPQLSQTFVSNEVRELRRQGASVEVLSLHPGDPHDDPGVMLLADVADEPRARLADRWLRIRRPRRYRRFRETVARLADEMGSASSQADWRRLPAAALQLEAKGVRALHAHFAWNAAAAAWALSDLMDVPWSVTLHANDIFSRRRNLEAKLAAADRLVTVCDYNLRYLRDEVGLSTDRPVELVVCGVELPEHVDATKDVDVVAVGRLVEKKGFDTLLDAAAELRTLRPEVSVEIIGAGPLESALRERIGHHGLGDNVVLRGGLDHERTLERIAAARVFTLPCRVAGDGDRDSMPVVIKEAMARAVPVVSTTEVAVPEMIDDSCGRLVPAEEPVQLAKAIDELLADPDLAASLGAAGRRRVEERFTLSGEVGKLRRMFEELTAS